MSSTWAALLPLLLLIVLMYFLMIRPQRKKDREINDMRAGLRVGDEIVTIGGILGKIVKIKDDSLIIAVGADKIKFELMKWGVSKVVKPSTRRVKTDEGDEEMAAKKTIPKRMKKAAPEKKAEEAEEAEEKTAAAAAAPAENEAPADDVEPDEDTRAEEAADESGEEEEKDA